MYTITRDGTTVTAETLPTDMPDQAKKMLGILGVTFYGAGAVKVTDEGADFWLAEVEHPENDPAEADPAEAAPSVQIVIDGHTHTGTISYVGPVLATVETANGPAMVTIEELSRWNPCPVHGLGCAAWEIWEVSA